MVQSIAGYPFGVEIECFGRARDRVVREQLTELMEAQGIALESYEHYGSDIHADINDWKCVPDGSVHDGAGNRERDLEVVSPKLYGEDGIDQLRSVLECLRRLGVRINTTCGVHVHHDASDLTPLGAAHIARVYTAFQSQIDQLLAPSRRSTSSNQFCRPMGDYTLGRIIRYANSATCRTLADLAYSTATDRYVTVNLDAISRHGTIEFRQHQGSLNATKIRAWIYLTRSIMDIGRDMRELPTDHATMHLDSFLAWLDLPDDVTTYLARHAGQLERASRPRSRTASGDPESCQCVVCVTDRSAEHSAAEEARREAEAERIANERAAARNRELEERRARQADQTLLDSTASNIREPLQTQIDQLWTGEVPTAWAATLSDIERILDGLCPDSSNCSACHENRHDLLTTPALMRRWLDERYRRIVALAEMRDPTSYIYGCSCNRCVNTLIATASTFDQGDR